MKDGIDINNILTLILGGGLVGTLTALFNGYRSLKDGAKTREKGTIEDLVSQRKNAVQERELEFEEKNFAFDQRDFWRNRAADLEYTLRQAGVDTPPKGIEPVRGTQP